MPTEYRAVLLLEGKPIFAIVVEVQLSRDEEKRASWPLYLTSLRSRVGCPTVLLVVAPDAIPVIKDPEVAGREPELAVLSAMAHGREEVGPAIAQAVLSTAKGLEDERFRLYVDLVVLQAVTLHPHASAETDPRI
jgi:hypothetical protein